MAWTAELRNGVTRILKTELRVNWNQRDRELVTRLRKAKEYLDRRRKREERRKRQRAIGPVTTMCKLPVI